MEPPKIRKQLYQPYIPIDVESQFYTVPLERCHLIVLIDCKPRVKLVGHEFDHIQRVVENISQFKQRLFNPCIVLFNRDIKYENTLKLVRDFRETIIDVIHSTPVEAVEKTNSKVKFFYYMLRVFKETYMNDENNSIEEIFKRTIDAPIMFMDENASLCSQAISHLSIVFEHMQQFEKKGRDWSSFRLSKALSGTIIQKKDIVNTINYFKMRRDSNRSLNYLLDEFFKDKTAFKDRDSFRYRYQLLFLGKNEKSQCFETQLHFDINHCSHSMISPCSKLFHKADEDNTLFHQQASFPPSYNFPLSDIQQVKSVLCEFGENCYQCCRKLGSKCDKKFFELINTCNEFEKLNKNCKCVYEKRSLRKKIQPALKNGKCYLELRSRNYNCHNQEVKSRRLCPCVLSEGSKSRK